MSDLVLLGIKLTDSEFKQLYDLANFPKYSIKESACFWVASDLSIECSNSYFFDNSTDREVDTLDEFLSYINEQKLLRILE